jgi:hypothetical protein
MLCLGAGVRGQAYDEKDTCFYCALTMLFDLRVQADGFLLLNVPVCLWGTQEGSVDSEFMSLESAAIAYLLGRNGATKQRLANFSGCRLFFHMQIPLPIPTTHGINF